MDMIQVMDLSSREVEDIFGGSTETYKSGVKFGNQLRTAIDDDLLLIAIAAFIIGAA